MNEITNAIRKMAKQKATRIVLATVKEVDEAKMLCDIDPIDEPTIYEVRLTAQEGSKGLRIVPKVGSWVMAVSLYQDEAEWHIIGYSEIEKTLIDATSIIFNGGENEGIVKVEALVSVINDLIQKINSLETKLATHTHTATPPGTPTTPPVPPIVPVPMINKTASEFENDKVKH